MSQQNIIPQLSEAELFAAFNIDLGQFIDATNGQEGVEHIDPTPHMGKDMWTVTYPKAKPQAMSREELERKRDDERRARVLLLAEAAQSVDMDSDDAPDLCSLIEPPRYQGARHYS